MVLFSVGPHPGDRGSAHGRDRNGARLLPILIKDVAGLVPGSYKGRGKGNRFLADLCDADVLIHVIDVTGQSDKDGNILLGSDYSLNDSERQAAGINTSPGEDAEWIREEMHRWIFGNIKVGRLLQNVFFSRFLMCYIMAIGKMGVCSP